MKIALYIVTGIILIGCNYHTGVIIEKADNSNYIEVQVSPTLYIAPSIDIYQWDTLEVGDTVRVHKRTYKLKK